MDSFWRVMAHSLGGGAVKQVAGAGKQQLQVVVQFGHGPNRAAAGAHRVGLVNGNGGWYTFDLVDGGFVHAVQKLARVGAEGFHITPLAFGEQGVKHQAGFARAAGPGDHGQLSGANVEVKVFEVVLACSADADGSL